MAPLRLLILAVRRGRTRKFYRRRRAAEPDTGSGLRITDQLDPSSFDGADQLMHRREVEVVYLALEITDRAPRNLRMICEIDLSPIKQPTRRATL